jgi:hypothetical protein
LTGSSARCLCFPTFSFCTVSFFPSIGHRRKENLLRWVYHLTSVSLLNRTQLDFKAIQMIPALLFLKGFVFGHLSLFHCWS